MAFKKYLIVLNESMHKHENLRNVSTLKLESL